MGEGRPRTPAGMTVHVKPLTDKAVRFIRKHAGKIPDTWIARRLRVKPWRVAYFRREAGIRVRRGRPGMPDHDTDLIFALRRSGVRVVLIAQRFKVSRQRIYQMLSRNGR